MKTSSLISSGAVLLAFILVSVTAQSSTSSSLLDTFIQAVRSQICQERAAGPCRAMYNIINGCCSGTVFECVVYTHECYCDSDCHRRMDCCSDIFEIGCSYPPSTPEPAKQQLALESKANMNRYAGGYPRMNQKYRAEEK